MNVIKENEPKPPWLLLVFSLAKKGASLRVTVWRKLQRYGALPLGNSGYFLFQTATGTANDLNGWRRRSGLRGARLLFLKCSPLTIALLRK